MMKMIVMNAPQSDQIGQLDEEKGVEKKIFTKSFTITILFSKFFFLPMPLRNIHRSRRFWVAFDRIFTEKNVESCFTTMKTTIFGENFLKVFKIRSNDKNMKNNEFLMFFRLYQNYFFLEVSTQNLFLEATSNQVQGRK